MEDLTPRVLFPRHGRFLDIGGEGGSMWEDLSPGVLFSKYGRFLDIDGEEL